MSPLAPYASHPEHSRGRRHPEPQAPTRNDFQRDRDRIVHSTAFRRLVYKTQVFLNHEGDLFRTRLTHSLEVAQLGRSIARALGLHEDLVEAVALAHDLGHTPFGHAGQDALNHCMSAWGGFEHNLQSLRVVDHLEHRYPEFDGLNLCFETREGVLKHCSAAHAQRLCQLEPGGVAQRFIDATQPSLEGQLCNLADSMAYNAHDIDDGVRSGLLALEQVAQAPLFGDYLRAVIAQYPALTQRRWLYEATRRMLSDQVYDVLAETSRALSDSGVASADEARQAGPLVGFSAAMHSRCVDLKRFLFRHLYRHPQVQQMNELSRRVVCDLFRAYQDQPPEMGPEFAQRPDRPRAIADFIAGMTDRYAQREHERLTGQRLW